MYARFAAAALAVAALSTLAACGGSGGGTTATPAPPATTAAATTAAATTAAATTTTAAPRVQRIDLDVANGKINGGAPPHVSIDKGKKVVLHVRSDVADEVHVHGYDLHGDVAPGKPVTIRFTASIPGRFEAELESRGLEILQFQVNP